jgi:hypothetical protein
MSFFATNYFPLTEEYFKNGPYIHKVEGRRPIIGIHIFRWDPNISTMTIKTSGGSIVKYHGNALVEGAVYWVGVSEILEISGSSDDTEIHGIISTFKTV